MSDMTNDGALAPADDNALFSEITSGAPSGFEPEPQPQPEPQVQPQPAAQPAPQPQQHEPAIPPARLREEAEARRTAERERDELRGQLQAFQQRQQPPQPQQPRVDPAERIFSDPQGMVRDETQQMLDPVIQTMHFNSRLIAGQVYGADKVNAAIKEFDELAGARQLHAAEYQQVMSSPNPFASAVQFMQKRKALAEVGEDLGAYRTRVIDEAMKDPEVQKRFLEATRAQALQAGSTVTRPVVPSVPNINRVGSAALPDNQADVSDADLFASTTSRKRA